MWKINSLIKFVIKWACHCKGKKYPFTNMMIRVWRSSDVNVQFSNQYHLMYGFSVSSNTRNSPSHITVLYYLLQQNWDAQQFLAILRNFEVITDTGQHYDRVKGTMITSFYKMYGKYQLGYGRKVKKKKNFSKLFSFTSMENSSRKRCESEMTRTQEKTTIINGSVTVKLWMLCRKELWDSIISFPFLSSHIPCERR